MAINDCIIFRLAGQGEIESKTRIMQMELGLAVGRVPRESDRNQNQTEHDNLGLGMIQWHSVSFIWKAAHGGWCHVCAI